MITVNKKLIVLLFAIVLFVLGLFFFVKYLFDTQPITVEYSDAQNVRIVYRDNDKRFISNISNGSSLRIYRDKDYDIEYDGLEGFADGRIPIKRGQESVKIIPDFSEQVYKNMIDRDGDKFTAILTSSYPKINLYTIDRGEMFERGKWYATTLTYKKISSNTDNQMNSDTLRVLFEKKDDKWVLVAKPNILLTTFNSPDVEVDALKKANSLSVSYLNDKI